MAAALALVLVVAALLIQPREDTVPENVDLKIEAVCQVTFDNHVN